MDRGPIDFDDYWSQISSVWSSATYLPEESAEAVHVLDPYDTAHVDASYVAVMGLNERVFPKRISEDPFFRDDEREAMTATGKVQMEARQERTDDERLLFYMAVTAAKEHLLLSFARSGAESDTLPSFYLDDVRAVFDRIHAEIRTLADVAPRPDECATDHDRLLAACASSESKLPARILDSIEKPPLPKIRGESHRRSYSRTRKHGVKPEPEGGGLSDRGTLYHTVLRRYFRKRVPNRSAPEADALRDELLAELSVCLEEIGIDAPYHRRRILERFLKDALAGFAARESLFREQFELTPSHFELSFGTDSPDDSRDYDADSKTESLEIRFADSGQTVQLSGSIDRVDLSQDGKTALVMDYKTGNTRTYSEMQDGKSLQMPVYMMALEQLWGKDSAIGCYDSPRESGRRRMFRLELVEPERYRLIPGTDLTMDMVKPMTHDQYEEMLTAARESILRAVEGIRTADILPTPGNHCRFCAYADCCRTEQSNVHDGEPFSILTET